MERGSGEERYRCGEERWRGEVEKYTPCVNSETKKNTFTHLVSSSDDVIDGLSAGKSCEGVTDEPQPTEILEQPPCSFMSTV